MKQSTPREKPQLLEVMKNVYSYEIRKEILLEK